MLIDYVEIPMYLGCIDFTKILAPMKLYILKVRNGWFDSSFGQILKLQKEMLCKDNTHLDSTHATKIFYKKVE